MKLVIRPLLVLATYLTVAGSSAWAYYYSHSAECNHAYGIYGDSDGLDNNNLPAGAYTQYYIYAYGTNSSARVEYGGSWLHNDSVSGPSGYSSGGHGYSAGQDITARAYCQCYPASGSVSNATVGLGW
jgi:hypothetical protein